MREHLGEASCSDFSLYRGDVVLHALDRDSLRCGVADRVGRSRVLVTWLPNTADVHEDLLATGDREFDLGLIDPIDLALASLQVDRRHV